MEHDFSTVFHWLQRAHRTLNHVDAMVGENRADVRQAVVELRRTLTNMTDAHCAA